MRTDIKEGIENSKRFFFIFLKAILKHKRVRADNTHFSEYGAASMASLVCRTIKDQNLPMVKYMAPSDFKENMLLNCRSLYAAFQKDTFNIMNYGATVADGLTLNTAAINKTIEACAKAVVVP